jgi:hypothetical protein
LLLKRGACNIIIEMKSLSIAWARVSDLPKACAGRNNLAVRRADKCFTLKSGMPRYQHNFKLGTSAVRPKPADSSSFSGYSV